MNVENKFSKNVGVIAEINGSAHIIDDKRVFVLRLLTEGKRAGEYVSAYWHIDNIKDITKKSFFSLPEREQSVEGVAVIH